MRYLFSGLTCASHSIHPEHINLGAPSNDRDYLLSSDKPRVFVGSRFLACLSAFPCLFRCVSLFVRCVSLLVSMRFLVVEMRFLIRLDAASGNSFLFVLKFCICFEVPV